MARMREARNQRITIGETVHLCKPEMLQISSRKKQAFAAPDKPTVSGGN